MAAANGANGRQHTPAVPLRQSPRSRFDHGAPIMGIASVVPGRLKKPESPEICIHSDNRGSVAGACLQSIPAFLLSFIDRLGSARLECGSKLSAVAAAAPAAFGNRNGRTITSLAEASAIRLAVAGGPRLTAPRRTRDRFLATFKTRESPQDFRISLPGFPRPRLAPWMAMSAGLGQAFPVVAAPFQPTRNRRSSWSRSTAPGPPAIARRAHAAGRRFRP